MTTKRTATTSRKPQSTARKVQKTEIKADPRAQFGACVRVPSGDRAFVEGIDPQDADRILITYEAGLGSDSYPLHLLTLVQESPNESAPIEPSQPAPLSELESLAAQFNALERDAEEARQTQLSAGRAHWEARRDQGAILLQAKSQVPHGQWEGWVAANCRTADGKPLSSRMAQNYMAVAKVWEEFSKNERHFAFGWEKGLAEISKIRKVLKPAHPTVEPGTESESAPMPLLEELKALYQQIGMVKEMGNGFCVERPDLGNPFPLRFTTPAIAWDYWQQRGEKLLALAERKPQPERQTEPLLGEPNADRLFSMLGIESKPVVQAGERVQLAADDDLSGCEIEDFVSDLRAEAEPTIVATDLKDQRIVVNQASGATVRSSRLSLVEAAREVAGSVVDAAKQLLEACSAEELEAVREALLSEQSRRQAKISDLNKKRSCKSKEVS